MEGVALSPSGEPTANRSETTDFTLVELLVVAILAGKSCTVRTGGGFQFGPYIAERAIPVNPITNSNTVVIVGAAEAESGNLSISGDGPGGGWKYDVISGRFIANDTNTDSRGVRFDSY